MEQRQLANNCVKFPAFMEPGNSFLCLQDPATGSYLESDEFSSHLHNLVL